VTFGALLRYQDPGPPVTFTEDPPDVRRIPENRHDGIDVAQTPVPSQDVRKAIKTLYRILNPGGSVPANMPGMPLRRTAAARPCRADFERQGFRAPSHKALAA